MGSRITRLSRARIVALALGVGAFGSLATAPASFAAGAAPKPPAVGVNCQLDGKISGQGSTFQTNALNLALITGFTQDVCGPVGADTDLLAGYGGTDPAGSTMVAYNFTEPGVGAAKNGSGAGLNAISCRMDPFTGTDLPYNGTQLTQLMGAPGTEAGGAANCPALAASPNGAPPYFPTAPYPAAGDAPVTGTLNAMNFPVAGGAVAIAVNLNGMCTGGTPTALNLTSQEFDQIWQGTINQWNDPSLTTTNPILTTDGCSGFIQRIVRFDNSGTTAITKTDLNGIDNATLCDGTTQAANTFGAWGTLAGNSPNTAWPTNANCKDGSGNVAPAVYTSAANGSGTLISLLDSTTGGPARASNTCPGGTTNVCGGEGGIGYAELGLWPNPLPAGVVFAHLESQAATVANGIGNLNPPAASFISPGAAGAASNCNPGANGLPGTPTVNQAVGLGGANVNWANDAGANLSPQVPGDQKENITYNGAGYPNCGLTFDFVMTGMDNETGEVAGAGGTPGCTGAAVVTGACQTVAGPFIGMRNDQLRTLYSFFTYVFSPLGQSYLDKQTYDELPAAWLPILRSGFQNNF